MALNDETRVTLTKYGDPNGGIDHLNIELGAGQHPNGGGESGVGFHHLWRLFLDNESLEDKSFK